MGKRRRNCKVGIYAIIHDESERAYVGQSSDIVKRWIYHKMRLRNNDHHCQYLQRMWNKYGLQAFTFEVLQLCNVEDLNELECFWSNEWSDNLLISVRPPGDCARGWKHSESTKVKMSISALKVGADPEERKRRSDRAKAQHAAGNFGQATWSQEVKDKMAKIARNNLLVHGVEGRKKAIGDSKEMSRRSYQRKIFKK